MALSKVIHKIYSVYLGPGHVISRLSRSAQTSLFSTSSSSWVMTKAPDRYNPSIMSWVGQMGSETPTEPTVLLL